jgi:hypothetical protein
LVGDHDDHANGCCGAIVLAARRDKPLSFFPPFVSSRPYGQGNGLPPIAMDPQQFENPLAPHRDYYAGGGVDGALSWWPGKQ